jgi:hypothetical protein
MPSILTHHYFANLLIEKHKHHWPLLEKHSPLVWLGSQGPDPFFFYGRAPFKSRLAKESMNQFGSLLHSQAPHQSIWPLVQHGWFGPQANDVSKAYVFGALTHYVLDRTCHPYVFYRTGFDEHGALTDHYMADHAKLEVEMDLALILHLTLSPSMYQPKVTLQVDPVSLQSISQLYFQAFPKHVHHEAYQQAVQDMKATYQFLYHGSWINRLLVILIAGKRSLPFSLIHPNTIASERSKTVLNLQHKKWRHPVTGTASTESVIAFIETSEKMMDKMVKLFSQDKVNESLIKTWCEDIDYDGKVIGTNMQYFQSLYPSYKGKPSQDPSINKSKKKSV